MPHLKNKCTFAPTFAHNFKGFMNLKINWVKNSCACTFTCYCLFEQALCPLQGFLFPPPDKGPWAWPTSQSPSFTEWAALPLRFCWAELLLPSVSLPWIKVISSKSFPTFQSVGKSDIPPGCGQRHPHSSTIMSLWCSRSTLPLSTYSMLSGLVFTGAQHVEGTRWGW